MLELLVLLVGRVYATVRHHILHTLRIQMDVQFGMGTGQSHSIQQLLIVQAGLYEYGHVHQKSRSFALGEFRVFEHVHYAHRSLFYLNLFLLEIADVLFEEI